MPSTGIFPEALKSSKVIQLFKKDDSSHLVNYKPISLLPITSKVFISVFIHDKMCEYFYQFNLLVDQQYGLNS